MTGIEDWARAEAEKRWPSYPTVGFSGADDLQQAAAWMAEHLAERLQSPEAIEAAAEAAALHDDYDGCFERVREWEALEQWERDAHPEDEPMTDREDCEWWRARIRAAFAAALDAATTKEA